MLIKTFDNIQFIIDDKYINKSNLLYKIKTSTVVIEPVPILVDNKILNILYDFMKIDSSKLSRSYNPYDLKFKQTDIDYFSGFDCDTLIELSNGCSYLEYFYCLELCCKMIAEKLKNKSVNVLKKNLGSSNEQLEVSDFDWVSSDE